MGRKKELKKDLKRLEAVNLDLQNQIKVLISERDQRDEGWKNRLAETDDKASKVYEENHDLKKENKELKEIKEEHAKALLELDKRGRLSVREYLALLEEIRQAPPEVLPMEQESKPPDLMTISLKQANKAYEELNSAIGIR